MPALTGRTADLKDLAQVSQMRQRITDGRMAAALLCLALAHGLVASSLLVECIPADGRSLVELIGQDPCHQPFGAVETHSGDPHAPTLHMENDPTDPCVDLSLDSFGISAGVMEIHPPSTSATDRLADASTVVGMMRLAPRAEAFFKQAREPVIPADCDSRLLLSLRI
jgi:hypothetical protein